MSWQNYWGPRIKWKKRIRCLEGAIIQLSKQFGKDYLIVSTARSLKASFFYKDGRLEEAEALLHDVNASLTHDDGTIPTRHLGPVFMLARTFSAQGAPMRADSLLRKHYADILANGEEQTPVGMRMKSVMDSLHTAEGITARHEF